MEKRIKELRKKLDLDQTEFGNRIGVKQGSVSAYEKGIRIPLDSVILSICREFNVNEEWLRTGEGEIFEELTEQQKIMKYTAMLLKDTDSVIAEAIKNFIVTYEQLDDASKKVLEEVARKYLNNVNKNKRPV